ncbi:MAG TPA: UDP-2,3-diacylglucosamine diphosphatase, partial [Elusimicrobiota bacterium]|nr:UDP-2,3-diacylglucosamine diphosphatase [Elusimicrobiota bacterium]
MRLATGFFGDSSHGDDPDARRYRTIWISDIHLGTRHSQAPALLDFLRSTESDYLYLVGDIIDGWQLKKSWYWPQSHNDVVQKILRKARKGTLVFLIAGNHDEFLRAFGKQEFGRITLLPEAVHQTADGRRLLVLHGDQFDNIMKYAWWLAKIGDEAYECALTVNRWFNQWRLKLGYPYWSLSAYLKHKVKNAVNFISSFEEAVVMESRRYKVDGVVCGHIHKAEMRIIDGLLYCNDGDWVESCTALVEHFDGRLELISWAEALGRPAQGER